MTTQVSNKVAAIVGLITTLATTQALSASEVALMEKVKADMPTINLQDAARLKMIIEENADILSAQTIVELQEVLESRAVNTFRPKPICDVLSSDCGSLVSSELDVETRLYEVMGPKDQAGH